MAIPRDIVYEFEDFRLETTGPYLLRQDATGRWSKVPLRPQYLQILTYLVHCSFYNEGRKSAHDIAVGALGQARERRKVQYALERAVYKSMPAIRRALQQHDHTPPFIDHERGKGYQFLRRPRRQAVAPREGGPLVDRDEDLAHLHHMLDTVQRSGGCQVVLLCGERGIGKTALVKHFRQQVLERGDVLIAEGECRANLAEPYQPLVDALSLLCRTARPRPAESPAQVLATVAPAWWWYMQMPEFDHPTTASPLEEGAQRVSDQGMIRQLLTAFDHMTQQSPLVVVLENLHWSDPKTLVCLAAIAQNTSKAKVLVLGTYRLADDAPQPDALRHLLNLAMQYQPQCEQRNLKPLSESAITLYLQERFPESSLAATLTPILLQSTDGNPLFLVEMLKYFQERNWLVMQAGQWQLCLTLPQLAREVPTTLKHLIVTRWQGLTSRQQAIVTTASVIAQFGTEFTAAMVAACLDDTTLAEVEQGCHELSDSTHASFLQWEGGGGISRRYKFIHSLYQTVLYAECWNARVIHHRHSDWLKAEAQQGVDVTAALAEHLQAASQLAEAFDVLMQGANKAADEFTDAKAVSYYTKARQLLEDSPRIAPDVVTYKRQRLTLLIALGRALMVTEGYSTERVAEVYTEAETLCEQVGADNQTRWFVQHAQWLRTELHGELSQAYSIASRCAPLVQSLAPIFHLESALMLGSTLFHQGEFTTARRHLEAGLAYADAVACPRSQPRATAFVRDPVVACQAYYALVLWILGETEQAQQALDNALAQAHTLGDPFTQAFAYGFAQAWFGQFCGNMLQTQEGAHKSKTLATEQGAFPHWKAMGTILEGWTVAQQGQWPTGVALIKEGYQQWTATGAQLTCPYYSALLAEACQGAGCISEAWDAIRQAWVIVQATGEHMWDAELHRLTGELRLTEAVPQGEPAAVALQRACDTAHSQQAKALELRAAVSLGRLWHQQGQLDQARRLLEPLCREFPQTVKMPDLDAARQLLTRLS